MRTVVRELNPYRHTPPMRAVRYKRTLPMRCPLCDAEFDPAESPAMPFCSERCKLIDLGRWLEEGYSFPADDDPEKYEAN